MARKSFDGQLKELKNQMILLGGMVEEAICGAVHAFVEQDAENAGKIAGGMTR